MRAAEEIRITASTTWRLTASAVVATIAFWAYTQTLLPGVDLGDTGGFQAAVPWPLVSARQAYPLYYTLAKPFVALLSAAHPARGLNLFSAVWGAAAIGLLTWVVAEIGRSTLAGVAAGVLFAFSYTFWTQAIIAEVYTLHLALVGACLALLLAYAARPTRLRLAIFFAIYALAFGNHLMMILLLVPFAACLLLAQPSPRELVRPAVVFMAIAIAVAGALQYLPNFLSVWSALDAPPAWGDRVAAFWFDVTKADWREQMVMGVGAAKAFDRLAMWGWDARQQFGLIGLGFAGAGAVRVWSLSRPWAITLWLAYAFTTVFAVTYNVGDSHVFFLPSHFFTAMFAGLAFGHRPAIKVGPAGHAAPQGHGQHDRPSRPVRDTVLALLFIAYAGWRAWDTWPAVDRHTDRRGEALVAQITSGIDEAHAVLATEMDWQAENAILYSTRWERTNVAWLRVAEVLPHFPFFVADNHAINRDVVLTADAAATVAAAYGPAFALEPIDPPETFSLATTVARIPPGAPYVLTRLKPTGETRIDEEDYEAAIATLTGSQVTGHSGQLFEVIAGTAGERPALRRAEPRPFRTQVSLAGDPFTIRMESWLPDDTFRRAGFGQVLRGHEQILIVERGISLVWFSATGQARTAYAAGLYAPQPRFRIARATLQLASLPQ